jgi:hypothetical protein
MAHQGDARRVGFQTTQDPKERRAHFDVLRREHGLVERLDALERSGATGSRPTPAEAGVGGHFYDTTLSIPVWSDGTNWRDATGTIA